LVARGRKATLTKLETPLGVYLLAIRPRCRYDGRHVDALRHACKMGLEGIVSKRLGSRYVSGRSSDWLKTKNLAAPGGEAGGRRGLGAMSKRKLKPWMQVEQAIIWGVAVIVSLIVAGAIASRAIL
jgi:hypothetical protein